MKGSRHKRPAPKRSMLSGVARLATSRPKAVVALAILLMIVMGGFGATVTTHLKAGGYTTDTSEAARAARFVAAHFPSANPNVAVLVSDPHGVDSPFARDIGIRIVRALQQRPDVASIQSHWTAERPDLAKILSSKDGTNALILVTVRGDESAAVKSAASITELVAGERIGGVTVRTTGLAVIADEVNDQVTRDLVIAEIVAVPIAAIVLLFVFGSAVSAMLPVAIGAFSVTMTLGILRIFTLFTDVSVFALNMTTALALALGIDYSLILVNRYREEIAGGASAAAAMTRTIQTAGRTVLFSALTVALAVSALAIVPLYFLRSFAYTAIAVVVAAALAALLVVPALIKLLGNDLEAFSVRGLRNRLGLPAARRVHPEESGWYKWTRFVMRHAVIVAVAVTALLLFLGHPFLQLRIGSPDERVLPAGSPSREAAEIAKRGFPLALSNTTYVVVPGSPSNTASLDHYATALSSVKDVQIVFSAVGVYANGHYLGPGSPDFSSGEGAVFVIASTLDPFTAAGTSQLHQLEAVPAPPGRLFGGPGPDSAVTIEMISSRLPYVIGVVAGVSLLLLLLFTGSLILPIKALIVNGMSLTATFGSMVWIFQQGHLAHFVGATPTGSIAGAIPILMFCLAFGISMDYEVFLLSRIREEWLGSDKTPSANAHSVAMGVARTGRIFTAAAALMTIVFASLATSGVSFMKMFGIGLGMAVVVDATIVRATLVPAIMQLTRGVNWWLPNLLQRLHARVGLEESGFIDDRPAGDEPLASTSEPKHRAQRSPRAFAAMRDRWRVRSRRRRSPEVVAVLRGGGR